MTDQPAWAGKTILIVDDMEKVRLKLADLFTEIGLNVVGQAENGLEAMEIIPKVKPNLVSLDIVMPVMDGIECFRRIHEKSIAQPPNNDPTWPREIKSFFLSCLANEKRVVARFAGEIPEHYFVPKYPTAETLKRHLDLIMSSSAHNDGGAKQSA